MQRVDLYRGIHKAIRVLLFDTTASVARADFDDPAGAAAAAGRVRRLCGFLAEHARHEDDVILPALRRVAPGLTADLRDDHARTDGLERELLALVTRLETAAGAERRSLGRKVQDRLGRLTSEHLAHLEREEGEANRALWAHHSDEELASLERAIVSSIEPPRLAEWLEVLLPALSRPERASLLGGLRAGMPAEAFEVVLAPARAALGEAELLRALEHAPVGG